MSSPPVQNHGVFQFSLQHQRTKVTTNVVERVVYVTALRPHLVAGGAEEKSSRGNHIGGTVVLEVVGVEQEQVGKVAAALQQAREWMRKALVRKERRTAAQDRETEITLLQLSGVLNCVTEISHLLQLLSYFVISWLLLDNILNFDVLPIIHFFQDNLSVVILSQ